MSRTLGAVLLTLCLGLCVAACDVAGTDPPEVQTFSWHRETLPTPADLDPGGDWGLGGRPLRLGHRGLGRGLEDGGRR